MIGQVCIHGVPISMCRVCAPAVIKPLKVGDEVRCDRAILLSDRIRVHTDHGWIDLIPVDCVKQQPKSAPRDPLLVTRQSTHGDFAQNARISQRLKDIMVSEKDFNLLADVHREALDMIALKLSRILSGQANYADHWRDLSGYSLLAMEACNEDETRQK